MAADVALSLLELDRVLRRSDPELANGVQRALTEAMVLAADNGAGQAGGDELTPERAYPTLRELAEDPQLLAPPEAVLPRLAWRGRATGLAGGDKSGKSTLAAQAVAALTTGCGWLGDQLTPGRAVVAAPDEAVGDTVRRLIDAGADLDRVRVLALRPPDLLDLLGELLDSHDADLVIVDSLAEWSRLTAGTAPDDGDAAGWGAVVRPLVELTRIHGPAMVVLHHVRRSDGQYRGSSEIAAALDCLIELAMPQAAEDPTLRRLRARARWSVEDYAVRLVDGRYVLGAGGPVSEDARIVSAVGSEPGITRTALRDVVGVGRTRLWRRVGALLEDERLVDRDGQLYLPRDADEVLL